MTGSHVLSCSMLSVAIVFRIEIIGRQDKISMMKYDIVHSKVKFIDILA
jgi:hypothetical protein